MTWKFFFKFQIQKLIVTSRNKSKLVEKRIVLRAGYTVRTKFQKFFRSYVEGVYTKGPVYIVRKIVRLHAKA